mmetsp:Transcript_136993/g.238139  ORF Transcript_136993/g.238139 Transcript_136993/m.238139 type:complete len:89 (+) Transcript_136993:51-317(+)
MVFFVDLFALTGSYVFSPEELPDYVRRLQLLEKSSLFDLVEPMGSVVSQGHTAMCATLPSTAYQLMGTPRATHAANGLVLRTSGVRIV